MDERELLSLAHKAVRHVVPVKSQTKTSAAMDEVDMLSDACLGVAQAYVRWDPSKGPLGAYAWLRAVGAVRDGMRERGSVTRTQWKAGIREADVIPAARRPLPMEVLLEDGWQPRAVVSEDPEMLGVDAVEQILSQLPFKLAYIVRLTVIDGYPIAAVGRELGLSESRISQMRHRAFALMAHMDLSVLR